MEDDYASAGTNRMEQVEETFGGRTPVVDTGDDLDLRLLRENTETLNDVTCTGAFHEGDGCAKVCPRFGQIPDEVIAKTPRGMRLMNVFHQVSMNPVLTERAARAVGHKWEPSASATKRGGWGRGAAHPPRLANR